jgi:ABC-2 type transport system ATP-binding protein
MRPVSTDNAIEVRNLRKAYGASEAVRGISFDVRHGEVFCLLGPNGAGKTTTVEILEGYRARSGGDARVLGMDPGRGQRALRERVGIVLQECGVQGELTVAELLEMYGRYHARRRPIDELIELVGLADKRDERARRLSGGQRRRLDLALALVGDPDVVFLDEPTTGFDPAARRQAWSTVRALIGLGKTIFLTTHYMDEAQALADRVAVMRGGEIVAIGSPAELGGRNARPAEIRFQMPVGCSLGDLPDAPIERRELDGDRVLLVTSEPVAATQRITSWALHHDVALAGFTVAQPTLEEIYLELTGSASATGETAEEVLR